MECSKLHAATATLIFAVPIMPPSMAFNMRTTSLNGPPDLRLGSTLIALTIAFAHPGTWVCDKSRSQRSRGLTGREQSRAKSHERCGSRLINASAFHVKTNTHLVYFAPGSITL